MKTVTMGLYGVFATVLLCFALSRATHLNECPHPEDNYPCYCEEDEDRIAVHCNHLTESNQFHQALSGLTGYKFSTVSVWMYDVGQIKSDAFKGPAINEIVFQHSTINLESPPFLGQETHLNRITFLSCFDEEDLLGSYSLGHIESLKEISFEKNDIPVVKNDWLTSSGPSLRSVTFDSCKIEKLEDKVFAKLDKLTTIFIMDNKITTISRSMFPRPAENLRSISLNGNQIDSLPNDIFEGMPSLRTVEMERNKLRTLDASVWSSVIESLSRVYLEDNPLRCDKDLKWISKKSLPKTFTGTCGSPAKLKDKALRNLTPADFH